MKEEPACPYADSTDVVGRYLAGTLPDAEPFEEHWFSCDRCWNEVRRGMEVRASLENPAARQAGSPAAPAPWKTILGVAAALVLAAGLWFAVRPSSEPSPPAFRGSAAPAIRLEIQRTAQGLLLTWPAQPGTDSYRIQLFGADGTLLARSASREPRASIDGASLPSSWREQALFARVEALDPLSQVVSDSKLVRTDPAPGK